VKKLFKTINIVHENKFHKEIECLMNAKHKNIVRFLGYCAEAHGKAADCEGKFVMANLLYWLLCFEYVPNGNLQKYITGKKGMHRFLMFVPIIISMIKDDTNFRLCLYKMWLLLA
jgi:serine/threonine protein kinase